MRLRPSILSLILPLLVVGCIGRDKGGQEGEEFDDNTQGGDGGGSDGGDGGGDGGDGGGGYDGGDGDDGGGDDGRGEGGSDDGDDGDDTGTPVDVDCEADENPTIYLSPDDSNSMASPVLARLALLDGVFDYRYVPIRPWEFMNYATFDYPPAEAGSISLHAAMVPDPARGDNTWALQVGIAAPVRTADDRANINLTFVLDTSCSMDGAPLRQVREAGTAMAAQLKAGDIVSLVTWSSSAEAVLEGHPVSQPNDPVVLSAFSSLNASGGTDLGAGLLTGFHVASTHASTDLINRLVLVSDGGANMGVTDAEVIGTYVGERDEDGIYVAGMGVGTSGTYNPDLMDDVTDAGRGASFFIGDDTEAWKILGDRFISTFDVAARDVRLELDLPTGFEIVKFSGEEYSTNPDEIEPQHLSPNDSMVFLQSIQTRCPESVSDDTVVTIRATWKDPISMEERTETLDARFGDLLAADPTLLRKGQAVGATADALKAWQDDALSTAHKAAAVDAAREQLGTALALDADDPDLAELKTMLDAL